MTVFIGDNIVSALGFSSEENYNNVKKGVSGLKFFHDRYDLPEPFMASEIDEARLNEAFEKCQEIASSEKPPCNDGGGNAMTSRHHISGKTQGINYTKLEKACIVSVADALKDAKIDLSGKRVLFILSTTKGNVFLLDENERCGYEHNQLYLWRSAELIAQFFGNTNKPLVVSNACISGAFALMAAQRELRSGRYDYVVVTGVDMLSKFVVTGFQSFKALSQDVCKPFDANRTGLNIGEAVATVIMAERGGIVPRGDEPISNAGLPSLRGTKQSDSEDDKIIANAVQTKDNLACFNDCAGGLKVGDIVLTAGAVRNDANHISGPSRTGEGSYLALRSVLENVDANELAFVCAHGTATPYNDEMESISLTRAGLQDVPVNSLKGYFGHTLGAAGILESVISMYAIKDKTIPGTYGFDTLGVTNPLRIVKNAETTTKRRFVKMLSGFGGCNVAMLFTEWV